MSACNCNCNQIERDIKTCPICNRRSEGIASETVRELSKEDIERLIQEENYYICKNNDCDVVFFNENKETILLTRDINMAADFNKTMGKSKSTCGQGSCACKK